MIEYDITKDIDARIEQLRELGDIEEMNYFIDNKDRWIKSYDEAMTTEAAAEAK